MTTPKYIIGTGFFHKPENEEAAQSFFEIWLANTLKTTAHNPPETIFVLSNGGCFPNTTTKLAVNQIMENRLQIVSVKGNLGHIHALIGKEIPAKEGLLCGWSASILTLAMVAYFAEADMIFKEQDCLAFGDWVRQLYAEIGDRKMLFGRVRCMPCAQSLFIIRHDFILEFVKCYLTLGTDADDLGHPEAKFQQIQRMRPEPVGTFSFGYDRDRPVNFDDDVFYLQHIQPSELHELNRRGLV